MTRRSSQGRAAAALLLGSGRARETGDGSLRTAYPTAISGTLRQRGLASARCSAGRSLRESSRNRRPELSPERHHGRTVAAARPGLAGVLVDDQPARRISRLGQGPGKPSWPSAARASTGRRAGLREKAYSEPTRSARMTTPPAALTPPRLSLEIHPPRGPRTENSCSLPLPALPQADADGSRLAPRDRPRALVHPPGRRVPTQGSTLGTGHSADRSRPLRILDGPAPR